jgi:hypothetical protein
VTPWHQFKPAVVGKSLRMNRREYDWVFAFGEDHYINVGASWRIKGPDRIHLTDRDDGHQYGLSSPVNAEDRASELVDQSSVESLDDDASTADLSIQLSNGLVVEVLTNSSGYESWQAYTESELAAVGRNAG